MQSQKTSHGFYKGHVWEVTRFYTLTSGGDGIHDRTFTHARLLIDGVLITASTPNFDASEGDPDRALRKYIDAL